MKLKWQPNMTQNINAQLNQLFSIKSIDHPIKNKIDFSFIFFSDASHANQNKYQLVFDIAEYADKNGFKALWMPERHFHPFGGIYPNPAILAASIAVKTKNIRLRSGSVVLPLHHPVEITEAWSMVDNLSQGRVDLGFACGWNPNDFITRPSNFKDRKEIWKNNIPIIQQLWEGQNISYKNGENKEVQISIYPKPIQAKLAVWFVVTKLDESFYYAGQQGYNILTMLQGIDLDELGEKIKLYRSARQAHGYDPDTGIVTLMLHTLVHENLSLVTSAVREPFLKYIRSALSGHIQSMKISERPTENEISKVVEYSYERYFKSGALFGSIADAKKVVVKSMNVGVNEIACLMDFIDDIALINESLHYVNKLRQSVNEISSEKSI